MKSNKKCVVKEIQREIDNNSKSGQKKWNKRIHRLQSWMEKIQNNTTELEKLQQARTRMEEKRRSNNRLIIDGQKDMQVKKEYAALEKDIANLEREKNTKTKDMLQMISKEFYSFCVYGVAKTAAGLIEQEQTEEMVIPDLTTRTIDALLKRGKCLCGTTLCENQLPYEQVMKLRETTYPKTIAIIKSRLPDKTA